MPVQHGQNQGAEFILTISENFGTIGESTNLSIQQPVSGVLRTEGIVPDVTVRSG